MSKSSLEPQFTLISITSTNESTLTSQVGQRKIVIFRLYRNMKNLDQKIVIKRSGTTLSDYPDLPIGAKIQTKTNFFKFNFEPLSRGNRTVEVVSLPQNSLWKMLNPLFLRFILVPGVLAVKVNFGGKLGHVSIRDQIGVLGSIWPSKSI